MAMHNPARSSLEFMAPHATQRVQGTIRVRALRRGFYDNHIIEAGEIFAVASERQIGRWMERVTDDAPAADGAGDGTRKVAEKTAKKAKPAAASENDVL